MLEPDLLRTFVAIADTGSFTDAGRRVHRTQSAVSMQIKRLEEMVGRPLFLRDGRAVSLTHDGETLLGHARRILQAHHEALSVFTQSDLQGTVTLGTPDDYAATFLPGILAGFAEGQCLVHVEVVCDATPGLHERLDAGTLDMAIVTQGYGRDSDVLLLEEPLVWATSARHCVEHQEPLPLALFHADCRIRAAALDALSKQGRAYRLAYTSISLAAIGAAVRAGLAVTAMLRMNVGPGMRILDQRDGFPPLPSVQIGLRRSQQAQSPVHDCLAHHIVENFRPERQLSIAV